MNIFLAKEVLVLSKQTNFNKHAIELEDGKQPLYKLIYKLGPVMLKTLKTYIKTYVKVKIFWPSKFFADILTLFKNKLNSSFYLCVNCQGLDNLSIKNLYLLPLISKFLDRLDWAKKFTYLNSTIPEKEQCFPNASTKTWQIKKDWQQ